MRRPFTSQFFCGSRSIFTSWGMNPSGWLCAPIASRITSSSRVESPVSAMASADTACTAHRSHLRDADLVGVSFDQRQLCPEPACQRRHPLMLGQRGKFLEVEGVLGVLDLIDTAFGFLALEHAPDTKSPMASRATKRPPVERRFPECLAQVRHFGVETIADSPQDLRHLLRHGGPALTLGNRGVASIEEIEGEASACLLATPEGRTPPPNPRTLPAPRSPRKWASYAPVRSRSRAPLYRPPYALHPHDSEDQTTFLRSHRPRRRSSLYTAPMRLPPRCTTERAVLSTPAKTIFTP